jgi:hypothetical protein
MGSKNNYFAPEFALKQGIEGQGVFAMADFKKGEVLFKMKGEISAQPTRTSVQIGEDKHIEDPIASHINHSCKANARVSRN